MSSFPSYPLWRGCASSFPLLMDREDLRRQANELAETVSQCNSDVEIEYRSSERDILHHVFRWDDRSYEDVFENGFRARPQDNDTPSNVYFNLTHHVRSGGRPGTSTGRIPHVFVSTTLNSGYYTPVYNDSTTIYRYEIYAPGGIWVAPTLGQRYCYPRQDEVAFVAGIAPQYIRSAQLFRAIDNPRNTERRTWDIEDERNPRLVINHNFNPQFLDIQRPVIQQPVVDHWDRIRRRRVRLELIFDEPPHAERRKREVSTSSTTIQHWYAEDVANIETYIDAAFRSSHKNAAYLFTKNEYVLINYAPGTTDDRVVNGPLLICDGYPSLAGTAFAEYGIDCAFGCHDENEAFIFSGNLCAHIDYAPGTTNDRILKGPMTIAKMFPFFKGTVFENGVDAAFEATAKYEAYLFKDNQYALINYSSDDSSLIAIRVISQGFYSLRGTIFESGIDAAFASHRYNEAYIFKGDSYARINFAPGTTDDYIIGGVKQILPNWPSLHGILPHKNRGLDVHDHATTADAHTDHYVHDEV